MLQRMNMDDGREPFTRFRDTGETVAPCWRSSTRSEVCVCVCVSVKNQRPVRANERWRETGVERGQLRSFTSDPGGLFPRGEEDLHQPFSLRHFLLNTLRVWCLCWGELCRPQYLAEPKLIVLIFMYHAISRCFDYRGLQLWTDVLWASCERVGFTLLSVLPQWKPSVLQRNKLKSNQSQTANRR